MSLSKFLVLSTTFLSLTAFAQRAGSGDGPGNNGVPPSRICRINLDKLNFWSYDYGRSQMRTFAEVLHKNGHDLAKGSDDADYSIIETSDYEEQNILGLHPWSVHYKVALLDMNKKQIDFRKNRTKRMTLVETLFFEKIPGRKLSKSHPHTYESYVRALKRKIRSLTKDLKCD